LIFGARKSGFTPKIEERDRISKPALAEKWVPILFYSVLFVDAESVGDNMK